METLSSQVASAIENARLYEGMEQELARRSRAERMLKGLTDDLARSNKDLEQFAYVASHDLQEPLRMVSSYTQLLEKRYKEKLDQDAKDFISFAVDGARRMQHLIRSLLAYSRISRQPISYEEVDCTLVLDEALTNLRILIDETKGNITFTSLPKVRGERTFLVQLFQNLINNGLKFHKPGIPPVLSISARDKNGSWEFTIKDNGIGIDQQYFERIFVIFQRLHSQQDYEGTGIGLSLCKKIVERHGGIIWLESSTDVGTTFHFTIPKQQELPSNEQPNPA